MLKKKGYYLEVATPLMEINFASRKQTKSYFDRLHIPLSFSWPIMDEYYSQNRTKNRLNISNSNFRLLCQENPGFFSKIDCNSDQLICSVGRATISISARGEVFPCSQYPKSVGNLPPSSLEEIYCSPSMKSIRSLSRKKIQNQEFAYNFCPGNNYSETGDPYRQANFLTDTYRQNQDIVKGGEKKNVKNQTNLEK